MSNFHNQKNRLEHYSPKIRLAKGNVDEPDVVSIMYGQIVSIPFLVGSVSVRQRPVSLLPISVLVSNAASEINFENYCAFTNGCVA